MSDPAEQRAAEALRKLERSVRLLRVIAGNGLNLKGLRGQIAAKALGRVAECVRLFGEQLPAEQGELAGRASSLEQGFDADDYARPGGGR